MPQPRPAPAPSRLAIVLFNLGGPDSPAAVRPFLTNLFTDPAILRMPGPLRKVLGRIIALRRTKAATANYAILGGRSPIRELTEAQGQALQQELAGEDKEVRCFVAMRYWHPFAAEAAQQVKDWGADEVVILPLYPQFSTTTTGSSMDDWQAECARIGLDLPTKTLCCFHSDEDFAGATAAMVQQAYDAARAEVPEGTGLRLLFSAHGLPETIIRQGDPYQWQVERTVAAVVRQLDIPGLDHGICYQSRVTPQKWLGPSTEQALEMAAHDRTAVIISPIAFVSEHSETLVELDVEYKELADKLNLPGYYRVPAQNSDPGFIQSLAGLVRRVRAGERRLCSFAGARQCPKAHTGCPHARAKSAA
jgi:ferrochelatase